MAHLTNHCVGIDASARIKSERCLSGFHGSRPLICNEVRALYDGVDFACSEGMKLHPTTLDCHSLLFMASKSYLDSQHCGMLVKPIGFARHRNEKSQLAIQCMYGRGAAENNGMSGDAKVQQILVDMVRIQVGKARMTELVDERSQHLRNIADEASFEFDRIANRAMKGFDASGSRVLRQFDVNANAIEKELMSARAELEAQSRDFEAFQVRIAYTRNEGLFFKNLYTAPRCLRYQSTLSNNKEIAVVTTTLENDFSSSYRQSLYGGLSLVMVSFIWSSSSAFFTGTCMRASKLASYGIVISLLLAQLAYVKVITGQVDNLEESED